VSTSTAVSCCVASETFSPRVSRSWAGRQPLEIYQHVVGAGELGDAPLDLGQVLADQGGHVLARRVPGIADGQDAADLGQGEPGHLSIRDERQPVEGGGRVVAVTGGRARWGRHEPGLLVEPDRLGRQARFGGEVTDQHGCQVIA